MQLGGASDLVNVGPAPPPDLVNAIGGASDLVNVGPPPATDLVNATRGGASDLVNALARAVAENELLFCLDVCC